MERNGGEEVKLSGNDDNNCTETMVEIKIKTLDSQTYTLRVDKCMPVPALKEQIATVTGVLSEQQRLICRGKVLKDDQLLSAYHVEDGHTLHLVVRQPLQSPLGGSDDHSANDPASSSGFRLSQGGSSVVVGTYITEPGDGALPDLSRIVSAVLGSFSVTNIGSGSEGADLREAAAEGLTRIPLGSLRFPGAQQADQTAASVQHNPGIGGASYSASVPLDPMHLPVIPDSLTTLSQYLTHMRHEISTNLGSQNNSFQAGVDGQGSVAGAGLASGGLPTPASLAQVILSTRQLLTHQAADSLSQLARELEGQANVTDPSARMTTQSNAMRAGVILQHLGALLLELGRTTMTLRMGQTPTESVVNAGPAVFISSSGPNPIMVQPLHYQPGTSFGAIPSAAGISGGSIGSGFLPRNIDIRIRTASQRDPTGGQRSPEQSNQSIPDVASVINEDVPAAAGIPASVRTSEVRVVPGRTVVAALPASITRSASDASRGSIGLFYPVLARVQHVSSGNSGNHRGPQSSDGGHSGSVGSGQQPNVNSTVPQEVNLHAGDEAHIPSSFDQLFRSIYPGEHIHVSDVNLQGMGTTATDNSGTNQGAAAAPSSQDAAPAMGDGLFLSNILRQIMPMISENTASGLAARRDGGDTGSGAAQTSSAQDQENPERRTTSRRRGNPPSSPSSKRQRR